MMSEFCPFSVLERDWEIGMLTSWVVMIDLRHNILRDRLILQHRELSLGTRCKSLRTGVVVDFE